MTMVEIINEIKEAYGTSTRNNNRFEQFVNSFNWDHSFICADGSYYRKGNLWLTVDGLNPFDMDWKPEITSDDATLYIQL